MNKKKFFLGFISVILLSGCEKNNVQQISDGMKCLKKEISDHKEEAGQRQRALNAYYNERFRKKGSQSQP